MIRLHPIVICGIACLVSLNLGAQSLEHTHVENDHDSAPQEAHLHGHAELTLVLEGNSLEISLESPAANIVGFEHKATSNKQQKVVENARSSLESATQLFTFSGNECVLLSAKANMSELISHDEHHYDDHDKKHNMNEDNHSEVTASYRYTCKQGEKLKTISVDLLDSFPGIERLKVMWITDSQQGSTELNSKTKLIRIR